MISETAMSLVRSGRFAGPIEAPTHYGVSGQPGDGPWIEVWLAISSDRIERAAYRTHGCPSSQASAAMACRLAIGRSVEEAGRLTGADLLTILGGLPEGKGHFAEKAVEALRTALVRPLEGVRSSLAPPRPQEP